MGTESEAYYQGRQAFHDGLSVCPYGLWSEDYFAWFAGWQWACNDHDDAEQKLFDAKFVSIDDFIY